MGEILTEWLHSEIDREILMDSLLENLYLLCNKNIERKKFDKSLDKHQIRQFFPSQNFPLYGNKV